MEWEILFPNGISCFTGNDMDGVRGRYVTRVRVR